MKKYKRQLLLFAMAMLLFAPATVFAHAAISSSDSYSPADIGTNYGFVQSPQSNTKTLADIESANQSAIRSEQRSSLVLLIIVALLNGMIMISTLFPVYKQRFFIVLRQLNWVTGALSISMLGLIIVSGILLSLWYIPFPGSAYGSIQDITTSPFSNYVRNVHYWASHLFFILLLVHFTRVVMTKIVETRKRIAYWMGCGLLCAVFVSLLLGTFLRSDQESYEAYAHFWVGSQQYLPLWLQRIADSFGSGTVALFRFFVLHAILIFAILLLGIVIHGIVAGTFRGMVKQMVMRAQRTINKQPVPQLRLILKSSLILWGITAVLALLNAPLMQPAFNGLEITKPPWYLLWIYALENIWGMPTIVIAPLVLLIIFIVLPLLSSKKHRIDAAQIVYVVLGVILWSLSIYANFAPPMSHLQM